MRKSTVVDVILICQRLSDRGVFCSGHVICVTGLLMMYKQKRPKPHDPHDHLSKQYSPL